MSLRAVCEWFLERVWLLDHERRARARNERQQGDAAQAFARARRWHAAARELSRYRTMPAALGLYWEALVRFAAAYDVNCAGWTLGAPFPKVTTAIELIADTVRRQGLGDALDLVIAASNRPPEQAPEDPRALRVLLAGMEAVTCAARRAAQAPSLRAVLVARGVRVTMSLLVVLGLSIALVHRIRAPRNVALRKHIFTSSTLLGQPEALVNGAIEWGTFGFHSQGGHQYVDIDLGRPYELDEARIYNRGDTYLDESVPLDVELSVDGRSYSTVARCTEFFTQATPCRLSLHNARARYFRVVRDNYIALSEIEVLGR